jgi:hypothetical protein
MSPPGPKSAPQAPRLGDVAMLAARTDRLDSIEMRIGRIEAKLDALIEMMKPSKSVTKR